MRTFLWLVGHNWVLSNEMRARKGMTDDASCTVCSAHLESFLHIHRDCYVARKVWDKILQLTYKKEFYSMDFFCWL